MIARQTVVPISDQSQIGEARRQASRLAEQAGLSEAQSGKVAIVVSELATNLSKYATGGEILLRLGQVDTDDCVEVLAIDRGPGIADVGRCLEDGYSTGGSSGTGLGAVRRLSSEFDVFSHSASDGASAAGTVVLARIAANSSNGAAVRRSQSPFAWGVISRPAPLETICGDSYRIAERPTGLAVLLVDGLGHGPAAGEAAGEATAVFDRQPFESLTTIIQNAHTRMRTTRGGALAIAQIDARTKRMNYAGVGNIAGHLRSLHDQDGRGLFSHNGTVGVQIRKIQEFTYDCPDSGLLVMHSDGLQSRWSLRDYPGLMQRHPAIIAAVLYRDFTRGRDDVTVAVVRFNLTSTP